MSGFLNKVSGFFFKDEEDMDDYAEERETPPPTTQSSEKNVWKEQDARRQVKKTNLISVPTRGNTKSEPGAMEMVLIKATSYDDMQEIAKHIKDRKVAVVNFEEMDKDIAQRMVDFLSGATFALDGVPRKVSGGTFIFSSSSVGMVGQIMDKNEEAAESPLDAEIRFAPNQWLRNK
ncbi:MAG: cell division protein SepF [Clostridiales bacterium]